MATREQISEWKQAGERRARDERSDEEISRLASSAETAALCADCFQPLAPNASVTLTRRWSHHTPASYPAPGIHIPAQDHWLDVPICLPCWLRDISTPWWGSIRGVRERGRDVDPFGILDEVRRHRCEGCGRPIRVVSRRYRRLPLRERCCCAECLRKATLRRANERRRVRHDEMACEACGTMFVPTQSTAKTCSNRCRQALFRQRHALPK